ncbi:hypothetical protein D3C72_2071230 [compost metagenome]
MHQALRVHFHALVALQSRVEVPYARGQPRQCPVEPVGGRGQALFKFRLTHGRYCPQDATIPTGSACPTDYGNATGLTG